MLVKPYYAIQFIVAVVIDRSKITNAPNLQLIELMQEQVIRKRRVIVLVINLFIILSIDFYNSNYYY